MNANLLRAKIVEAGYNQGTFLLKVGIGNTSFWRKIRQKVPFTTVDIVRICDVLSLTADVRDRIFFGDELIQKISSGASGSPAVSPPKREAKPKAPAEPPPAWVTDFELYKTEGRAALDDLLADEAWLRKAEAYFPEGADIPLTVNRAWDTFWGEEAGWINKKKAKTQKINWGATLLNMDRRNVVYKKGASYGGTGINRGNTGAKRGFSALERQRGFE